MDDKALKILIEGLDDVHQFVGDAVVPEDLSNRVMMEAVKGLLEVDEYYVYCTVPFI